MKMFESVVCQMLAILSRGRCRIDQFLTTTKKLNMESGTIWYVLIGIYEDFYARSRHLGFGLVITSQSIVGCNYLAMP